MTVRRASFFGLVGLVFAVWIVAVGCNLDASGFGDTDDFCTDATHCDDNNACTVDSCGADGVCVHDPIASGQFPDGVQGNCKIYECDDGKETLVFFAEDIDDGNDCTADQCTEALGATHDALPAGSPCSFQGALGTCDGEGSCTAECGFAGDDGNEVGCGSPPNPCQVVYCDKAKGKCVTEKLDGIPSPGAPEPPGECGGQYCVDGEVDSDPVAMGTPCIQVTGPDAGKPGVCSGSGACIGCNTKLDCQDAIPESDCHKWVCMSGTCQNTTEPDGPLSSQMIGDCHVRTCAGGIFIDQIDPGDVKDDGNECTADTCDAGNPISTPLPTNSPCGGGGALYCDGGVCKGCTQDIQCLGGTECKTPKCDVAAGDCFLQPEPMGKVINAQTAGDCINNVCDANGNIVQAYNPGDPQDDTADCTVDTCVAMNQTSHTPAAYGSTCNDGGGIVCDAAAHCVGKPCSGVADCPAGTFCTDGFCCDSGCGGGCQACSGAKKGGGQNGLCGAIAVGDPDAECPGKSGCSAGMCQPLGNGSACDNVAGECTSGNCVDGFCCNTACNGTCLTCSSVPGTCSAIANGQDPSNECAQGACDGTGACRKDNGQPCAGGGDCLSTICADSVCCNAACGGTCQACNLAGSMGACTNVPLNQDPANECTNGACNGGGQCKFDNGQPCGIGGDCLSGQCADGVCCNTACGGTCQACTAAKTGGVNGTCANVTAASDPDTECVGVTNCNGSGACTKLPNGSACTTNGAAGECMSGNCVDGVCCNSGCGASCNACNVAGSVGTCTPIPSGTDPGNECNGNGGNDVCNGAGQCKEINGTGCVMGTECLSGFCQDGVCCNNTCTGTCQSCNLAGTVGMCTNIANGQDPGNECAGVTTCNGAGACTKLPDGTSCSVAGECMSGNCIDGVCCDTACGAACFSCNLGGSAGTCTPIPLGTDPGNDCPGNGGTDVCNGAGACKEANGTSCTLGSECASGFCVEGVCCNAACTGDCLSCLAANTPSPNGTCDEVDTNTDPQDDCPGAQVCNMMGLCVGGPDGSGCATGTECASTRCIDNVCCNSDCTGECQACSSFKKGQGANGVCGNIVVNTDPDMECAGPHVCNGSGACVAAPLGSACTVAADCASGFCIDSVCCDTDCTGTCRACSLFKQGQGTNGVCGNIKNGDDPDTECSGASTCDGAGMCTP